MKSVIAVLLALLWSTSTSTCLAEELQSLAAEESHAIVQLVDQAAVEEPGNLRRRLQCSPSATVRKLAYGSGEQVEVIINICQSSSYEWFGIWQAGTSPGSSPALNWQLTCGGQTCRSPQNIGGYIFGLNVNTSSQGSSTWPLPSGQYVIYYNSVFGSFSTATFSIGGGGSSTPASVPAVSIPNNSNNAVPQLNRRIRVACAGDSLTFGRSRVSPGDDYPTQLAQMLGWDYELYNFGRNAMVASMGTGVSYDRTGQFQGSLQIQPDIYLLMIGTNDVRDGTASFGAGLSNLLQQAKNTGARVIVATPPWIQHSRTYTTTTNAGLVNQVIPQVRSVASSQQVQLLDIYATTVNQPSYYTFDGLHPNRQGYAAMASAWRSAIQCNRNGVCEVGETCSACPSDCFVNC